MEFYEAIKKSYPLYNFAMVTDGGVSDKKTIFKYI